MRVPIMKQGDLLIASLQDELTDAELLAFRDELAARIGETRARGVVLNVRTVEVLDSFATRTLRGIALAARLRGAEPVIVGIQPAVAFAMVQLGLELPDVDTALDLDAGLELIARRRTERSQRVR